MKILAAAVLAAIAAHLFVLAVSIRLTAALEDALLPLTDDDLENE